MFYHQCDNTVNLMLVINRHIGDTVCCVIMRGSKRFFEWGGSNFDYVFSSFLVDKVREDPNTTIRVSSIGLH